jgi:hypothetical protein
MHPAYFETRFRTDSPPDHWPPTFAIITAHATTGETWSPDQNAAADQAAPSFTTDQALMPANRRLARRSLAMLLGFVIPLIAGFIALSWWQTSGTLRERAAEALRPSGNPFLDLCLWKGRFPSRMTQFCTQFLKTEPLTETDGFSAPDDGTIAAARPDQSGGLNADDRSDGAICERGRHR